jgi:hypothetical protein
MSLLTTGPPSVAEKSWYATSAVTGSIPKTYDSGAEWEHAFLFAAENARRALARKRWVLRRGALPHAWRMRHAPRRRRRFAIPPDEIPADLYDYAREPVQRRGRRPVRDDPPIKVTDDWPEMVPITEAELRVMEAHFGDVLDEIFGPLP